MPAKAKSKAKSTKFPKITVEEIEDAPKVMPKVEEISEDPEVMVKESKTEEPMVKPDIESVPRVTSFSQLDASMPKTDSELADVKPEMLVDDVKTADDSKPTTSENETKESSEQSSEDVKEWLKDIRPDTTKDVEKGGNGFNGKLFFGLLIVFVLLGALAGGLFYYKQQVSPDQKMEEKMEEPTSAPTATPTPEEKVDLTSYSVNVQNGSGVAGQAGVVQDLLVAAGFDEANFKTGNASTYDYTSTEVQVKADVPEAATAAITKALEGSYTVSVAKDNLAASSAYDIVVIVGTKK